MDDTSKVANHLFGLVNMIVEQMITQPKEIETMYKDLVPKKDKEKIKKRDQKNQSNQ